MALSESLVADEWGGATGFIHEVVAEHYMAAHSAPENNEYYVCGPPLMLQAVLAMLSDYNVPAEQIRFDEF